jgi:hypothetical protein
MPDTGGRACPGAGGQAKRTRKAHCRRWDGKYGEFVPAAAADGIFTISPRRARAWHEGPFDGTVWTFTGSNAAE